MKSVSRDADESLKHVKTAWADPVENIIVLEGSAKNLVVIMKDGKVYKNLLAR